MAQIDFAAVKAAVTFEDAIQHLALNMKKQGKTFRSPCPSCQRGDDRSLAVTPGKGYFCHAQEKGGDVIAFVAHIRKCSQREAGAELQERFLGQSEKPRLQAPKAQATEPPPTDGLQPLAYLTHDHPVIEALQLSGAVCQAIGIGFANKGKMRGRVAFPLRLPDGTLCGYLGLATTADMEPLILLPENLEERCSAPRKTEEKPQSDDVRRFLRLAVNNG